MHKQHAQAEAADAPAPAPAQPQPQARPQTRPQARALAVAVARAAAAPRACGSPCPARAPPPSPTSSHASSSLPPAIALSTGSTPRQSSARRRGRSRPQRGSRRLHIPNADSGLRKTCRVVEGESVGSQNILAFSLRSNGTSRLFGVSYPGGQRRCSRGACAAGRPSAARAPSAGCSARLAG